MLSTPTARTRNGMISNIISVAGTPIIPKIPIDADTESNTIITPNSPNVTLLSIMRPFRLQLWYCPRESVIYKNIRMYDTAIVARSPYVSLSSSSCTLLSVLNAMDLSNYLSPGVAPVLLDTAI